MTDFEVLMNPVNRAKDATIKKLARMGRKHKIIKIPVFIILVVFIFLYNLFYYAGLHFHLKDKMARMMAVVMTFILVVTTVDLTGIVVRASEYNSFLVKQFTYDDYILTSYGTVAEDIGLPGTVGATISKISVDEEIVSDENCNIIYDTQFENTAVSESEDMTEVEVSECQSDTVSGDEVYESEYVPETIPENNQEIISAINSEEVQDIEPTMNDNEYNNEINNGVSSDNIESGIICVDDTLTVDLEVSWECESYNPYESGDYEFTAILPSKYEGCNLDYSAVSVPKITVHVDCEKEIMTCVNGGIVITVASDIGVFPEGCSLSVRTVVGAEEDVVESVIDEVREDGINVCEAYTFDITVLDIDGNAIEPDTSKGKVSVTFIMHDIANDNLSTDVYHIIDADDGMEAEIISEDATEKDSEITVDTDGFSYYTVEFTYGEKQYVLNGYETVELEEVLAFLELYGNIDDASFSDTTLVNVYKDENTSKWYMESLQPFFEEETLYVVLDSKPYYIIVTDSYRAVVDNSGNSYEPTVIKNGSFENFPTMSFYYNGTYYDKNSLPLSNPYSISLTNIQMVPNGVDEGWNTTETTASGYGILFDYCNKNRAGYSEYGSVDAKYENTLFDHTPGDQITYVEMNYSHPAALYQDLSTRDGDVIIWTLNHAIRFTGSNTQSIRVDIGAPLMEGASIVAATGIGASIDTKINPDTKASYTASGVTNPNDAVYGYYEGGNLAALSLDKYTTRGYWYTAQGTYIIPDGQHVTRFAFVSLDGANQADGNMLDEITFSTLIGNIHGTVLDDGKVQVTGYWGDTDSSNFLHIMKENSGEVLDVDMSEIAVSTNKNFTITLPAEEFEGESIIYIYHTDYPSAKRKVKLEHEHHWCFEANGNVLSAYCNNDAKAEFCECYGPDNKISLIVNTENMYYTGNEYAGLVLSGDFYNKFYDKITVLYEGINDTTYSDSNAPQDAGDYVVKVTVMDNGTSYVASSRFSIYKSNGNIIYVSATGSDTSGNGTLNNPYATIGKAYSTIAGNTSATIALLSDITLPATDMSNIGIQVNVKDNVDLLVTSASSDGKLLVNDIGDSTGVYSIKRGGYCGIVFQTNGGNLTLRNIILDGGGSEFNFTDEDATYSAGYLGGALIAANTRAGKNSNIYLDVNSIVCNNINTGSGGFACGGAIILGNNANNDGTAKLYMKANAIICNNMAPRHGGAITLYRNCYLYMTEEATITGNQVDFKNYAQPYYGGGAVLAYENSEVHLTDNASVTNNYVDLHNYSSSGNSPCAVQSSVTAKIYLSGNARIFDNFCKNIPGTADNSQANVADKTNNPGSSVIVESELGDNAKIGISVPLGSTTVATAGAGYSVTNDDANHFFDDSKTYTIYADTANNKICLQNGIITLDISDGNCTDCTSADITLSGNVELIKNDVTIFVDGEKLASEKYQVSSNDNILTVNFVNAKILSGSQIGIQINKNGYIINSGNIYTIPFSRHNQIYSSSNNKIQCYCSEDVCGYHNNPYCDVEISAPTNLVYTGSPIEAVLTNDTEFAAQTGTTLQVTYYMNENCDEKTSFENSGAASSGAAPVNAGTYYAQLSVYEGSEMKAQAVSLMTIEKANRSLTLSMSDYTYATQVSEPVLAGAYENPSVTYKWGLSQNSYDNDISTLTPTSVHAGTTIYVMAYVDETVNYNNGQIGCTLTVECKDLDDTSLSYNIQNSTYIYDNTVKTPVITITDNQYQLVENTDYEFDLSLSTLSATDVGTYTIVINGIGNYTGSKECTYIIKYNEPGGNPNPNPDPDPDPTPSPSPALTPTPSPDPTLLPQSTPVGPTQPANVRPAVTPAPVNTPNDIDISYDDDTDIPDDTSDNYAGNIDIVINNDAGEIQVSLASDENVINACFTEEEMELLDPDEDITIILTVDDSEVTKEEEQQIANVIKDLLVDDHIASVGGFFSLELVRYVGDGEATIISETSDKLSVVMQIPEDTVIEGASYYVISDSGNIYEAHVTEQDGRMVVVFDTDDFTSNYALVTIIDEDSALADGVPGMYVDSDGEVYESTTDLFNSHRSLEREETDNVYHWIILILSAIGLITEKIVIGNRKKTAIMLIGGIAVADVILNILSGGCTVCIIVASVSVITGIVIFVTSGKRAGDISK